MNDREAVWIARRFQGPERSGNGGYVAGRVGTVLADAVDSRLVPQVTLRMPPPLERDLELVAGPEGARLLDGESVVATAVPVAADFLRDAAIDPVAPEEARAGGGVVPRIAEPPVSDVFRVRAGQRGRSAPQARAAG